jgi:hypothetical protein
MSYPRRLSQLASALPDEHQLQHDGSPQHWHHTSVSNQIPIFAYSPTQSAKFGTDPDGPSSTGGYISPRRSGHMTTRPRSATFRRVFTSDDLSPHQSTQPPFRRANPEGGFISVSVDDFVTTVLNLAPSSCYSTSIHNLQDLQPVIRISNVE